VPPPAITTSYFTCVANHSGGYSISMEQPHPVEKAKELAAEVDRGRSPRTPLLAITGITLVVGVAFAILVTIALILYFVYGGK
jgi:hypothetical protein